MASRSSVGFSSGRSQHGSCCISCPSSLSRPLISASFERWTKFTGIAGVSGRSFDLVLFGTAATVVFSLIAQIGEQVDFLRFLPARDQAGKRAWWAAYLAAGPGWIIPGMLKLLAGSFLAFLAIEHFVPLPKAVEPTRMYLVAFGYVFSSPQMALAFTGAFVVISQLKINVTNAYAGSIAWSNFFSRLTHSHPGRVVWLVFNSPTHLERLKFWTTVF